VKAHRAAVPKSGEDHAKSGRLLTPGGALVTLLAGAAAPRRTSGSGRSVPHSGAHAILRSAGARSR
jgi:hypothetical protein